jgi:hypothetical protein
VQKPTLMTFESSIRIFDAVIEMTFEFAIMTFESADMVFDSDSNMKFDSSVMKKFDPAS